MFLWISLKYVDLIKLVYVFFEIKVCVNLKLSNFFLIYGPILKM